MEFEMKLRSSLGWFGGQGQEKNGVVWAVEFGPWGCGLAESHTHNGDPWLVWRYTLECRVEKSKVR